MSKLPSASRGVNSMYPGEQKDCTVRALTNIGCMDYAEAHEFLKGYGRINGEGLLMDRCHEAYMEAGLECIGVFGDTWLARWFSGVVGHEKRQKGCTLKTFIEKHQEGSYVVYIKGHVLALVDGDIVDLMDNSANARVLAAWKYEG